MHIGTHIDVYLSSLPHSPCYLLNIGSLRLIKGKFYSILPSRGCTTVISFPASSLSVSLSLISTPSLLLCARFLSLTPPTLPLFPLMFLDIFWCVLFALWALLYREMSSNQSFMTPHSLLHQKLWFASASTAAIEITISSYSTGTSTHRRFLNIADDLKSRHTLWNVHRHPPPANTHTHTLPVPFIHYLHLLRLQWHNSMKLWSVFS